MPIPSHTPSAEWRVHAPAQCPPLSPAGGTSIEHAPGQRRLVLGRWVYPALGRCRLVLLQPEWLACLLAGLLAPAPSLRRCKPHSDCSRYGDKRREAPVPSSRVLPLVWLAVPLYWSRSRPYAREQHTAPRQIRTCVCPARACRSRHPGYVGNWKASYRSLATDRSES